MHYSCCQCVSVKTLSTIVHYAMLFSMKIVVPKARPPRPAKRHSRARKGEGSLKLRGKTWWYIIPNPSGGKRIEKSCETSVYAEAVRVKNKALLDAGAPNLHPIEKPAITTPATIKEVLDQYAKYCEKECPRSWRSMRTAIKHLKTALGSIVADNLTTADTDQFRDDRITEAEVSDSTVNRELGYLRAALKRESIVTPPRVHHIPYMRRPSEKDCVREGFIERADYLTILPELPASLQAIFVCAFHTGARSGELKLLQWPQINLVAGIIELRPKTTKNSEGRWIPIWGDMRTYLERQKAIRDRDFPEVPWVFFWHEGHHRRAVPGERLRDFRFAWSEACIRAGFPDLLFHDLRRSAIKFADQEAGISPQRVRLMSGHKTESVYNRYNIAGVKDIVQIGRDLDAFVRRQT